MEDVIMEQETVVPAKRGKKKRNPATEDYPLYNDIRNYVRTKDAAKMFSMSENELISVAREIGAFVKIRRMNYCRIDIMFKHFEDLRELEKEDYRRNPFAV